MTNPKRFEEERQIFGNLFLIANRLQTLIDRDFAPHGFTAKQWFLMASIGDLGGEPRLGDVAHHMGSSHQNVKELAKKLEASGYLAFVPDPEDRRVKRMRLTEKTRLFWQNRQEEDLSFFKTLFGAFTDEQIEQLETYLSSMASILRNQE